MTRIKGISVLLLETPLTRSKYISPHTHTHTQRLTRTLRTFCTFAYKQTLQHVYATTSDRGKQFEPPENDSILQGATSPPVDQFVTSATNTAGYNEPAKQHHKHRSKHVQPQNNNQTNKSQQTTNQ